MTGTVLITGAGGFVGSHLAEGFLAMGRKVTGLDLAFDAATRARLSGAVLVEAALTPAGLKELPAADLVVHAAAITTPPDAFGLSDAAHLRANVDLLTDCLDFAVTSGANDFVFLSSSGVFSVEDGSGIHLETTPATGNIAYALAKKTGETLTEAANSASLRAVSVRLGPVYGPHEAARNTRTVVSQIGRWIDRAKTGEPIIVAMPEEYRDWTFAPDLAHALDALLRLDPTITGVVHLTSADIISNLDLAHAVAALVAGSEVRVEPSDVPPRLPMASIRVDMPSFHAWTPLAAGLAQTVGAAR